MHEERRRGTESDQAPPEDRPDEPGAEGGSKSPSADKLPGRPRGRRRTARGHRSALGRLNRCRDALAPGPGRPGKTVRALAARWVEQDFALRSALPMGLAAIS